jgi:hypothetical protein
VTIKIERYGLDAERPRAQQAIEIPKVFFGGRPDEGTLLLTEHLTQPD